MKGLKYCWYGLSINVRYVFVITCAGSLDRGECMVWAHRADTSFYPASRQKLKAPFLSTLIPLQPAATHAVTPLATLRSYDWQIRYFAAERRRRCFAVVKDEQPWCILCSCTSNRNREKKGFSMRKRLTLRKFCTHHSIVIDCWTVLAIVLTLPVYDRFCCMVRLWLIWHWF